MARTTKTQAAAKAVAPSEINLEDMMDTREAADYLGLSRRTLEDWRTRLAGPAYYKPEGTSIVWYHVKDVNDWIKSSRVEAGRQP